MHYKRKSGILLHPTSLPGRSGIGSFGTSARSFVDFLTEAGQTIWQVLPLNAAAYGNSPYSCYSSFAGNPLLIDLELLADQGDLPKRNLPSGLPEERVDYQAVETVVYPLLREAAAAFFAANEKPRLEEFWRFCDSTWWLHDYALFMALKTHFHGLSWCDWPQELVRREPGALEEWSAKLGVSIGEWKYMQWQFFRQWHSLREYANGKGIEIFGDVPIFVAYDSSDVWENQHLFKLDAAGKPVVMAGVPPDYFSATGQLWGNPLYCWERHADSGYGWWIERIKNALSLYDIVRIDHFRGFAACWEVPAGEGTAINGSWVTGPGRHFFDTLRDALGDLPIVAEDLGTITPDVEELRDAFGLPGMKVLQFAFDSGPTNPYLPHNHVRDAVVYTGTHDNDTTAGWFASLPEKHRKKVLRYLNVSGKEIAWDLIRTSLASVAARSVVPLQDILSLGTDAKMNRPGTPEGNWSWRFREGDLTPESAKRLRELTELYGRGPERR